MGTFGPAFEKQYDDKRIRTQMESIRDTMLAANRTNTWLSLKELEVMTHYTSASISAQLRHLRKKEFGSFVVDKRRRGHAKSGLWEYHLEKPKLIQEKLF